MFDVLCLRAIEDGKAIFPLVYTNDHDNANHEKQKCLPCLKAAQGPYIYSCQLLNDPVDDSTLEFKRDWFRKFEFDRETVAKLAKAQALISIDPAFRLKETNDFTGIVVTKTTEDNFVYVLEAKKLKINAKQLVDEIFSLVATYAPYRVLVETVAAQIVLVQILQEEMRKRGVFFSIEEQQSTSKETKAARIRRLIPHYANGRVLHAPGLHELESELIEFPRGSHDDVIDALSFQSPYWQGINSPAPKKQVIEGSWRWHANRLPESKDPISKSFKGIVKRTRRW